jgi:hypothetical protein
MLRHCNYPKPSLQPVTACASWPWSAAEAKPLALARECHTVGGRTMALDTPRWRSHTPIMAPRCRDQWGRHYDAKHPTVPAARQRGAGKGRSGVFGGFGRSRPRPRARCPTRQPPHVSTLRPRALGAACAGHPGADAFDNLVCLVLANGRCRVDLRARPRVRRSVTRGRELAGWCGWRTGCTAGRGRWRVLPPRRGCGRALRGAG